jgi:ribonuclease-3
MDIFNNFKDTNLLETALTHRSALNEGVSSSPENNERFEFLGDAVLELATTGFLFEKCPDEPEGKLTAYRSALVKTETLAEVAQDIGLDQKILMSKGEENTGGRNNIGILADSTEALIGGIYLDRGYDEVVKFLEKYLFPKFEYIKKHKLYKDAKSLLQEMAQADNLETPIYEVVKEDGPDHDKTFTVAVVINGEKLATGDGHSKQRAQQKAARQALEKWDNK